VGPDRTLTFFHNKGLVVDGEAVVVSSTNWSDFSVTLSREAGVIVRDPEVAGWYAAVFDHDFQHAADPLDRISYQAFLQEIRKIR